MVTQPPPPRPSSKQGGEGKPHQWTRAREVRFEERTRFQLEQGSKRRLKLKGELPEDRSEVG